MLFFNPVYLISIYLTLLTLIIPAFGAAYLGKINIDRACEENYKPP
jgi:hypothetical protein